MARTYARPTVAVGAALTLLATACSGGGDDTLEVWIMEGTNPDATAYFDDITKEFEEKTGTEVNVEFVPWADAHDKFTTAMAGGTAPDVAEVGTTWTPEFADAGALVDLTDRIGDTDAYSKGLVEAGTLDDKLYGVPWYAGVRSVVYRTDVFEDLDIDTPTNWKELREAASTIADEKRDMTAFPVAGDASYQLVPFVWGAGGDVATQGNDGKWSSGIDSTESREGISYYTDLALEHDLSTKGATTWKETDLQDNFADGTVAMMISGSWTPKAIADESPELEDNMGVFPIPGQDGGHSPSFLGGSHLSVFNDSENQDRAWEFVETLTNDANAGRWTQETTYFPGKQEQLEPFTKSKDPLVRPFAEQMNDASRPLPAAPNYGKVQEGDAVLQRMTQSILNDKSSVDEATAKAAADIEKTLNEGS